MRRFFVDKVNIPNMELVGAECNHIINVLRFKAGDEIVLCPNDGIDYIYEIVCINKKSIELKFLKSVENECNSKLNLTVFFGLLKGDKSEFVVTKLTELGVSNIVPFVSKFTVKVSNKIDRLERAGVEACKQCGRAILPTISDVIKFKDIVNQLSEFDKVIFAYEDAYIKGDRLSNVIDGSEKSVALIIGSEGGFAPEEVEMLVTSGVNIVTLGRRILRAETASIATSAVIMQMCGEWE